MGTAELDIPWKARITTFSEADQVGRMLAENGTELRFGRSACQGFAPTVGLEVFVTTVGDHPLGGKKALKARTTPTPEKELRASAELQATQAAAQATEAAAKRREEIRPLTSEDAITRRVKESVLADEGNDADTQRLYELVDDLKLVGRSPTHVRAILRGVAESHPMAHFGSPGPLVHYVETFPGFEDVLFELAVSVPTHHFLWMLGRCVNGGGDLGDKAAEILRAHFLGPNVPEALRQHAASFLAAQETKT
jgi:hypothetical protein